MKQFKVKRTAYKHLTQSEILLFAQNLIKKTFEKETYKDLADRVVVLKSSTEVYDQALTAAQNGGKANTIIKNIALATLKNDLDNVAEALDFYGGNSMEFITDTGNEVRTYSNHKSFTTQLPAIPVDPVVQPTTTRGVIQIACEVSNPKHVLNVAAEWSEDEGVTWNNGNYFTPSNSKIKSMCKGEMKNLPSFKEVMVRFRSIGKHDIKSDWTTPIVVPVL